MMANQRSIIDLEQGRLASGEIQQTPRSARCHQERSQRYLESPEQRRIPGQNQQVVLTPLDLGITLPLVVAQCKDPAHTA
jgi:hypothetical protein